MRALAVLIALTGCGRVEFGPRVDAGSGSSSDSGVSDAWPDVVLANHDEDGDGLDDAIDTCPHLPIANTDTDGDGVGDGCDIEPTVARQQWRKFWTMRPGDVPARLAGTWTQQADSLVFDGIGFASVTDVRVLPEGTLVAGATIDGLTSTASFHQLAFGGGDTPGQNAYFLEMQETAPPGVFQSTFFDGSTYTPQDSRTLATGIHTGDITMAIDYVKTPTLEVKGALTWPGEAYNVAAPAPQFTTNTDYSLNSNDIAVTVKYFGVIETGP